MSNKSSSSNGIGFIGLLTIVFITLKLLEKISWSWWWVLSPILIRTGFVISLVIMGIIIAYITRPKTAQEKAARELEDRLNRLIK